MPSASDVDLSAWRQAEDLGDGRVLLPMAKSNQMAHWAQLEYDYKDKSIKHEKDSFIAYNATKIELMGDSDIVQIHTNKAKKGTFNVFVYEYETDEEREDREKRGEGRNENWDFQSIEKSLNFIDIYPVLKQFTPDGVTEVKTLQPFVLAQQFVFVVKINHSKDGTQEYQNPYGMWRLPDTGEQPAINLADANRPDTEFDERPRPNPQNDDVPF